MDQIMVKNEMSSDGDQEILLFYVDENGENQQGILTTMDSLDENQGDTINIDGESYVIETEDYQNEHETEDSSEWTDECVRRLLIFYIDNKETFKTGTTTRKHLWTIACKTMLHGKEATDCDMKLISLRQLFYQSYHAKLQGATVQWPYYDLCEQAFNEIIDFEVPPASQSTNTDVVESTGIIESNVTSNSKATNVVTIDNNGQVNANTNGVTSKPMTSKKFDVAHMTVTVDQSQYASKFKVKSADPKMEEMLQLYKELKKMKNVEGYHTIWDAIASKLGAENGDHWKRRFYNSKQHYLRLVDKRAHGSTDPITWPYMTYFDELYQSDPEFHKKYGVPYSNEPQSDSNIWDDGSLFILVKYYYDYIDDFENPAVPDSYLWNEVGRQLYKPGDICEQKYDELKESHAEKYLTEGITDFSKREPLEILFDIIIAKEVQIDISVNEDYPTIFTAGQIDKMVMYVFDNLEVFKDPIGYFLCWDLIGRQLYKEPKQCWKKWNELCFMYKRVLNDKKENPDVLLEWKYMDDFDRIFDYGMNTNLLDGYKPEVKSKISVKSKEKVAAKKVTIEDENFPEPLSDDDYDERGLPRRLKKYRGESKSFKILEYYLKHKDKFSSSKRMKQSMWEPVARECGVTAEQIAHRFRTIKRSYMVYLQREIDKPEVPIFWPYYSLCKKVFGYRAVKSSLAKKYGKTDIGEDWSTKEIKKLITYLEENFEDINEDENDVTKWSHLASELNRSESVVLSKFLELKNCYKLLLKIKNETPEVKVPWKFFTMFHKIYNTDERVASLMKFEPMDEDGSSIQADEDYECIIVLPEGEELSDISNAQFITRKVNTDDDTIDMKLKPSKWNKNTKRMVFNHYLNYIRQHQGKPINSKDMWTVIASKITSKTPVECKRMFLRNKKLHKQRVQENNATTPSPYSAIFQKIFELSPKFIKGSEGVLDVNTETFTDFTIASWIVEKALYYYLEHIEEFTNPQYEKKYLWMELGKHLQVPARKVFHKINYMKKFYNAETNEVAGESTNYGDVLKEILSKEQALAEVSDNISVTSKVGENEEFNDDETEQLLNWYLKNLDKFKNPKFNRTFLWKEAASILNRTPWVCSKTMNDIRTLYRNKVRNNSEDLTKWRFFELCQKIYGTGKKNLGSVEARMEELMEGIM